MRIMYYRCRPACCAMYLCMCIIYAVRVDVHPMFLDLTATSVALDSVRLMLFSSADFCCHFKSSGFSLSFHR